MPSNETCETVKELVSSSIENVRVGLSEFPSLSDSPDPLLDVRDPVMLKNSPGRGFAVMASITIVVWERTVIVFSTLIAAFRSEDPLKRNVTLTNPRG